MSFDGNKHSSQWAANFDHSLHGDSEQLHPAHSNEHGCPRQSRDSLIEIK